MKQFIWTPSSQASDWDIGLKWPWLHLWICGVFWMEDVWNSAYLEEKIIVSILCVMVKS